MKHIGSEKNREIKHENVLTVQFSTMLSSCRETEELLLLKKEKNSLNFIQCILMRRTVPVYTCNDEEGGYEI